MPKVSILVPTYNVEKYLVECMESIVNQTLQDIEIICVDDGSTDNSGKILDEYASKDKRIKVIHKENGGYGKAMNVGLDNATGEYIGIVEPDDYVALDMYETLYNVAKENDLEMVKSDFYRYSTTPETKNIYFSPCDKTNIYNKVIKPLDYIEVFNGSLSIWAAIYNRKFLNKNNIRFLETPGASFQDTSFGLKVLFDTQQVLFLNKALYHYRVDNANSSVKNNSKIFCICDELYELEKRYKSSSKKIKKMINALKIDKYTWNYNRLAEEGKASFYEIYNTELRNIIQSHDYVENFIPETIISNAKNILGIIENSTLKKNNIIQQIFSIKNNNRKTHKIVTIFGLKIKIKIRSKKALIIEQNNCHGECLPGYINYFIKFNYKIDILINKDMEKEKVLEMFKNNPLVFIKYLSENEIIDKINSKEIKGYDYCFINSEMSYAKADIIFHFIKKSYLKTKFINVVHRLENLKKVKQRSIPVVLKSFDKTTNRYEVNPLYFGEIKEHEKNKCTNFIVAGNIQSCRKNYNILIDSVQELLLNNITNFKITVIGKGNILNVPENIRQYFEIKGRLSYSDMYKQMQKADFFLTLLDPENTEHDRYVTLGTSGSFQLINGFNLPCLISSKFANVYGYNNKNSIVYDKNSDLTKAMIKAINLQNKDYKNIKVELNKLAEEISIKSFNNFKKILTSKRWYLFSLQSIYLLIKEFLQNIFSIKNEPVIKKHKIITILGLKFKIKRKSKSNK